MLRSHAIPSLSLVALLCLAPADDLPAATIPVDGTVCSLADAILAANGDTATGGCPAGDDLQAGGDVIDLRTDVTLSAVDNISAKGCANGLPAVVGVLSIEGNGHAIVRSTADGIPDFRILDAEAGKLTLSHLTIANGYGTPGCDGGGVAGAVLTLKSARVTGNTVNLGDTWAGGGGVHGTVVTVVDSTVSDNVVGNAAIGGGGGGIGGTTVNVVGSIVSGNRAGGALSGFPGGGIFADTVTVTNTLVSNNTGYSGGGGVAGTTVTLRGTTVAGNHAVYSGAGIRGSNVDLFDSTVSGNDVFDSRGPGQGGGISAGTLTATQSTIANNLVSALFGGSDVGGGISAKNATLINTIVAGNEEGDDPVAASDCAAAASYQGLNLIGDGSCGAGAAGQVTGSARLGPLADNGGPTPTHALLNGSPAIDRVAYVVGQGCDATSISEDQRGVSRPQPAGGKCDIGAFELPKGLSCLLTGVASDGVQLTVQATANKRGLAAISVRKAINASVTGHDGFPDASTAPVVVSGRRVDTSKPASLALLLTGGNGQQLACDVVSVALRLWRNGSIDRSFKALPRTDRFVSIANGRPGLQSLRIEVDGVVLKTVPLTDGVTEKLEIPFAMLPVRSYALRLVGAGKPGATADVAVSGSIPKI